MFLLFSGIQSVVVWLTLVVMLVGGVFLLGGQLGASCAGRASGLRCGALLAAVSADGRAAGSVTFGNVTGRFWPIWIG